MIDGRAGRYLGGKELLLEFLLRHVREAGHTVCGSAIHGSLFLVSVPIGGRRNLSGRKINYLGDKIIKKLTSYRRAEGSQGNVQIGSPPLPW